MYSNKMYYLKECFEVCFFNKTRVIYDTSKKKKKEN